MRRHRRAIVAIAATLLTLAVGGATLAGAAAPVVSIDPAEETMVTAVVKGSIDPGDLETNYHFEFATQKQFEDSEWAEAGWAGNGGFSQEEAEGISGPVAIGPVTLEGLAAGTTYHLRLVAENADGTEVAVAPNFETEAATAPGLTLAPATDVFFTKAKISGTIDPEGGNTDSKVGPLPIGWELQISLDPVGEGWQYAEGGTISAQEPEGGGQIPALSNDPLAVEKSLEGLQPGKTYSYRLLVTYAGKALPTAAGTFETDAVAKPIVTIAPVTSFDSTTASFSGTVNPNAPGPAPQDPAFDATWSFSCDPACPVGPEGGKVAADNSAAVVADDTTHLEPNTPYTVTLKATNAGGASEASATFQTPAAPPTITAFEAGPVQHNQAGINGQVNPHNSPTTYWFEWGAEDCSANPCQAFPASKDASAGAGPFNQYVFRELGGLSPQTTYHFRLVAENEAGVIEGPNRSFTTAAVPAACPNPKALGVSHLPDCRAWELVSPPNKNGGDVVSQTGRTNSSSSGDAVSFQSLAAFGDVVGTGTDVEYISRRNPQSDANGWATHAITPPLEATDFQDIILGNYPQYEALSSSLDRGVFFSLKPLTNDLKAKGNVANYYLRSGLLHSNGSSQLLTSPATSVADIEAEIEGFGVPRESLPPLMLNLRPLFSAASDDFQHVLFESGLPLTADTTFNFQTRLYESAGGEVRLVGRIPSGSAVTCDDSTAEPCIPAPSSEAGISSSHADSSAMISADGSKAFFQVPPQVSAGGDIYVREEGVRTTKLNAPEDGMPVSAEPAQLWDVSSDGTRSFFTTKAALTAVDRDGSSDVYMYDSKQPAGERLTLITDSPIGESSVSRLVLDASDDGRYLYFVANGRLVPGEPNTQDGIFAWHDGELSYVGGGGDTGISNHNSPRTPFRLCCMRTSRVSADGSALLFKANDDAELVGRGGLAPYDHGICEDRACDTAYLYDADSGRLKCVSCNALTSVGSADIMSGDTIFGARTGAGGSNTTMHLSRALSANGDRVFFNTGEALVSDDTNGVVDAYMYDAATDAVHLISSGTASSGSYFLDASDDGKDVFFNTREQLSRWDIDGGYDLYDARVEGGFEEPAPTPAPCLGESCRESQPAAPPAVGSGSSTLAAPGDPVTQRCRKGHKRVVRKGKIRCVRRKSSKTSGHRPVHRREANR